MHEKKKKKKLETPLKKIHDGIGTTIKKQHHYKS